MLVGTFLIPFSLFGVLLLLPWFDRRPERHPVRRPLACSLAGPDLSRIGRSREQAWLAKFIYDPASVKPGSVMPPYKDLSEAELQALAAYLASLR